MADAGSKSSPGESPAGAQLTVLGLIAAGLLMLSVSIMADIAKRFLIDIGLPGIGVLAAQAFLTALGGGALIKLTTEALANRPGPAWRTPLLAVGISLGILVLVLGLDRSVPFLARCRYASTERYVAAQEEGPRVNDQTQALATVGTVVTTSLQNAVCLVPRGVPLVTQVINDLQHAVALDPMYGDAYYRLGEALDDDRQFDQAISAYRRADQLAAAGPTSPPTG